MGQLSSMASDDGLVSLESLTLSRRNYLVEDGNHKDSSFAHT